MAKTIGEIVLEYGRPSCVVDKSEQTVVERASVILEDFLKQDFGAEVSSSLDLPLLRSFSTDGTPLKLKTQVSASSNQGIKVQRTGARGVELLCCIAFLRRHGLDGRPVTKIQLAPPYPLEFGKNALALQACVQDFGPTLRESGHRGVAIEHLVCDRAYLQSLDRMSRQRLGVVHKQIYSQEGLSVDGIQRLNLMSWSVSNACAAHDAHKALSWAMSPYVLVDNVLKDLCIVVESLRNSLPDLSSHLHEWLET
eukprot:6476353-Amphidinium_carterae.1